MKKFIVEHTGYCKPAGNILVNADNEEEAQTKVINFYNLSKRDFIVRIAEITGEI